MTNNLQLHSGSPSGRSRRKLDEYPTPPEATIALMEFMDLLPMHIWEPAAGDGSMADVMEDYGHVVTKTDIQTGQDFLAPNTKVYCEAIITNPPFNQSAEFIKKAVCSAPIVAMLLKSQYWHAKKRYDLFVEHPPSFVLPLTWRLDFLYKERGKGTRAAPTMETAWSVWGFKENGSTKYIPLEKPEK